MTNVQDKVAAVGKANLEAAIQAANITLASAERLLDLQLAAVKGAVADSARTAKALTEIKDAKDLLAFQTGFGEPGIEKAVAYSRNVYEIAVQAQSDMAKLVEERLAEFNQEVIGALEQAAKSAPAGFGTDAAVAAVKSAVAASSSAYDTMSKAAKQVAELTEANVTALAAKTAGKKKAA